MFLKFSILIDLPDNQAGAGDPLKGSRVLVVKPDVILDGLDQVTAECFALDSFPCDFREPAFDLVGPGELVWP